MPITELTVLSGFNPHERAPRLVVVDLVQPGGWVGRLPGPAVPIDEGVVHEEERVAGGRADVGHDGADAVVAVGVRPSTPRIALSRRWGRIREGATR